MPTDNLIILVLGEGAREHALYGFNSESPSVKRVLCAPGNGGIDDCDRRRFKTYQHDVLEYVCRTEGVDLVVVGPEAPLSAGVVDFLARHGIAAFGPTQAASILETSKAFTKLLCAEEGIPTAPFEVHENVGEAGLYIQSLAEPPVVKASGLCAGKGVVVADSHKEAIDAAFDMLQKRIHGDAGSTIVIEKRLSGRECSVMALCDGVNAVLLPPARDYKRVGDGDTGPNTGGMGAISPVPDVDEALLERIKEEIILPTLRAMHKRGTPFHGLLYAGIMLTEEGPMLLEYNVRFGDPETQVVLPRIESDLVPYLLATRTEGGLADLPPLQVSEDVMIGVTLAMEGYPGKYKTGVPIRQDDSPVFIAGAELRDDGMLYTTGGRIATVVAGGATFAEAREAVYRQIEGFNFDGRFYRTDIGADVV
ncbi:MAG TPA: phosphoribosylamine--glycine ligase [Candidatus Paceibacterota bacterium]|nr:phosphoribosylamine--glycine ligase [Candidatus Paceibacterota bacterium]